MRICISLIVALVSCAPSVVFAEGSMQLESGTSVSARYEPSTRLYWKPDVGIDRAALDAAGSKFPESVVFVLLGSHIGEEARLDGGRRFRDFEAVTGTIQLKLFSNPRFLERVDEETGLSNTAVVLLSLDPEEAQNRFDYFPSSLHEKYGLGRSTVLTLDYEPLAEFKRMKDAGKIAEAMTTFAQALDDDLQSAIRARARTVAMMWMLFWGFVVAVLACIVLLFRRANEMSKAAKEELQDKCDHWKTVIEAKRPGILALRGDLILVSGLVPADLDEGTQTHSDFKDAREKIGKLVIMDRVASEALEQIWNWVAAEYTWFQRTFTTGPYEDAEVRLLEEGAIAFDAETALSFHLNGQVLSAVEMTGVPESMHRAFSMSFAEYDEEALELSNTGRPLVKRLRDALLSAPRLLREARQALGAAALQRGELAKRLPSRESAHLKGFFQFRDAAEAQLDAAGDDRKADPTAALKRIDDVTARVKWISQAISELCKASEPEGSFATVLALEESLVSAGQTPLWIAESLSFLVANVSSLFGTLSVEGAKIGEVTVTKDINALLEAVRKAIEVRATLDGAVTKGIAAAREAIDDARKRLSEQYKLDAGSILKEESRNPDEMLDRAKRFAGIIEDEIDEGDIAEAESTAQRVEAVLKRIESAIADTEAAFKAFEESHDALKGRITELGGFRDARAETLETLEDRYRRSVFVIDRGEEGDPLGDGTVLNNLEQADEILARCDTGRESSQTAFTEGNVLRAAVAINLVNEQLDLVQALYRQIERVADRVAKALKECRQHLVTLVAERPQVRQTLDRQEVQPATVELFETAGELMGTALEYVGIEPSQAEAAAEETDDESFGEGKYDPFVAVSHFRKAVDALNLVREEVRLDRERLEKAQATLQTARLQLRSLGVAIRDAKRLPNSNRKKTGNANRELKVWSSELDSLERKLGRKRQTWAKVDREIDKVRDDAASLTSDIKQLILSHEAQLAIADAEQKVEEAIDWTGKYATLHGKPGLAQLNQAKSAVAKLRFQDAIDFAEKAYKKADSAIEDAEEEEERKKRAAARRRRELQESLWDDDDDDDDWSIGSPSIGGGFGGFGSGGNGGGGISMPSFTPSSGTSIGGGFTPSSGISI